VNQTNCYGDEDNRKQKAPDRNIPAAVTNSKNSAMPGFFHARNKKPKKTAILIM
jgi:hypothetical protein